MWISGPRIGIPVISAPVRFSGLESLSAAVYCRTVEMGDVILYMLIASESRAFPFRSHHDIVETPISYSWSIFAASTKSLSVNPSILCVQIATRTLPQPR